MGQCSNVQQNSFKQQMKENLTNLKNKKNSVRVKNQNKKNSFSKITYIEHNQQIIYQFDQISRLAQTLTVKKWSNRENSQKVIIPKSLSTPKKYLQQVSNQIKEKNNLSQQHRNITLVQQINDNLFITNQNSILQIFSIQNQNMDDNNFYAVAQLYYELSKLNQNLNNLRPILQNYRPFILLQNLYIQKLGYGQNQTTFIFESQHFQNQIVSLVKLGKHMHQNDIQWQDGQFVSIIEECLLAIQILHQQNIYEFQEFFIDIKGNCFCLGGFTFCKEDDKNLKKEDLNHLHNYLIETLYGDQIYLNQTLRSQIQEKCKFTHPLSIKKLKEILQLTNSTKSNQNLISKKASTFSLSQIQIYITSFKAKNVQKNSQKIATAYSKLGEYYKSKQILIQLYCLSLYNQILPNSYESSSNSKNKFKFHKQFIKNNFSKNQNCLELFIKVINLQKKIMKTQQSTQIQQLCTQFVKIVLFMSKKQTQQGNYLKSLAILEKIQLIADNQPFLKEICQNWAVQISKAQNYYFLENIEKAQKFYNQAFKKELNETTLCKIVQFYISVLNWQHAINILRQYQSVIDEHYLYQFFVSKCILARALCISPSLKQNQQQKYNYLRESAKIFLRVLQRQFKNNVLLIDTYEALGDCYFYMFNFSQALIYYQKSLALIQFQQSTKKVNQNQLQQCIKIQQEQKYSNQLKSGSKSKNKSILNTSISFLNSSPSFLNYQIMKPDKKAVLLSSIANVYLMQKKYDQSLQTYQKARKNINHTNQSLKDSIIGNMGICLIQMGRKQQGKQTIKHIFKDLDIKKVENDINYIFLKQQAQI